MKCECDFAPNVWVYKSSDLTHSICLYLKNITNLCTDNVAKAHKRLWRARARKRGCRKTTWDVLGRSRREHAMRRTSCGPNVFWVRWLSCRCRQCRAHAVHLTCLPASGLPRASQEAAQRGQSMLAWCFFGLLLQPVCWVSPESASRFSNCCSELVTGHVWDSSGKR